MFLSLCFLLLFETLGDMSNVNQMTTDNSLDFIACQKLNWLVLGSKLIGWLWIRINDGLVSSSDLWCLPFQIEEVQMLLNAQQLALEILSNMCCPDGKGFHTSIDPLTVCIAWIE